jgi:hypothetical protein
MKARALVSPLARATAPVGSALTRATTPVGSALVPGPARFVAAPLAACCLAACLAACTAAASREPLHYPPLPAQSSGSSLAPAFVPAPELAALSLTCTAEEPVLENALDDDCDGKLDGVANDGSLLVALAYPRGAALRFWLQEGERDPTPLALPACAEANSFCVVRLDTKSLPHGQHHLLVQATAESAALPSSVVVSASTQGKLGTYLLRLDEAGPPRRLGQLANP